jgi:hypothetical protein
VIAIGIRQHFCVFRITATLRLNTQWFTLTVGAANGRSPHHDHHHQMRRFYFQIPAANVIECIWAHSLTDAKAKAAIDWMPWWQQIEWLNPEHVTDPSIHV